MRSYVNTYLIYKEFLLLLEYRFYRFSSKKSPKTISANTDIQVFRAKLCRLDLPLSLLQAGIRIYPNVNPIVNSQGV